MSKKKIAVLGPKHTFSDVAAEKYLKMVGKKLEKHFAKDVDEIFELVEKGVVEKGIVPIENMINGTVRETLDALFQKNVKIIKEISIPIHHYLAVLPGTLAKDIKSVVSHSQALNQCKKFLRKYFPKTAKEAVSSTTMSIEKLIKNGKKEVAVIVPKLAAIKNKLKIIGQKIEDNHDNETTFVVIEKGGIKASGKPKSKGAAKTSIAFSLKANKPGALFEIFKEFADAKINLSKIESRPTKKALGKYVFYLDFAGSPSEKRVQNVLKKIEKKVAKIKILGSY